MEVSQGMELNTSAKLWFSSITSITCFECGTPLELVEPGVGVGVGPGAPGVGVALAPGGADGVVSDPPFFAESDPPPQPAKKSEMGRIAVKMKAANPDRAQKRM